MERKETTYALTTWGLFNIMSPLPLRGNSPSGNPLKFPETIGDCHASLRTGSQ